MAAIGRNEPCPCGSGRKYKQCCAVAREGEERALRALARIEDEAMDGLMTFVEEAYGVELTDLAWADFIGADEPEEPDLDVEECGTLFFPWFLCNWIPRRWEPKDEPAADATALPQRPLAREFLETKAVSPAVESFLGSACAEPFTFFAVQAAAIDRSVTLRDLLTGREVTALEHVSHGVVPGTMLYARALSVDGITVLFGCAPYPIPGEFQQLVVALREETAPGRVLSCDEVHALDEELRGLYWSIADEMYQLAESVHQ